MVCLNQEDKKWIVKGWAMTDDFDLQNEIISDEAMKKVNNLENLPVFYNHDKNQRIGEVLESRFDKGRIWIKCEISKLAPQYWKQIQEGNLNHFSIRGEAKVETSYLPEFDKEVTIINDLQLEEISLVSSPANPQARAIRAYIEP